MVSKTNAATKKAPQKWSGLFSEGRVTMSSQTCMETVRKAEGKIILAFDLRQRTSKQYLNKKVGLGQFWRFEAGIKLEAELVLVASEKAELGIHLSPSPITPFSP